jgi:hypothetical protein
MKTVLLDLTEHQQEMLSPLLEEIGRLSDLGTPGMLLAQIAAGQMKCEVMDYEKAKALRAALGKTTDQTFRTFDDTPAH